MVDRLTNFQLFFSLLTTNLNFDLFFNEITDIYITSCSLKTKELSQNRFWMKDEIANKMKSKHYLFKRYKDGAIPYSTFIICKPGRI